MLGFDISNHDAAYHIVINGFFQRFSLLLSKGGDCLVCPYITFDLMNDMLGGQCVS